MIGTPSAPVSSLPAFLPIPTPLYSENSLLAMNVYSPRLFHRLVVLALVCAGCLNASFTIEQVMSAPFASDLTAALTGARFAWIENEQGRRNIYTAAAPDFTAHKLTSFDQDDGQEISELAWAPDGSYLLFTRGGDFENGGENPNPNLALKKPDQSLWRVDVRKGGSAIKLFFGHGVAPSPRGDAIIFLRAGQVFSLPAAQLSAAKPEPEPLLEQKGEQSGLRWAPDGHAFAFSSTRRDHSFVAIYTLATKSVTYVDPSTDEDSEPVWSPDSKSLAFLRIPSVGRRAFFSPQREGFPWSIRVAEDAQTGVAHEVFRAHAGPGSLFHEIVAGQQLFWSAGNRILFPWERTGWTHLYSIPAAGGGVPAELTPGEGIVEHVALSADRKTVHYSTNIGDIDRRHIAEFPADSTGSKAVTQGQGIEWEPKAAADNSAVAWLASSYDQKAHAVIQFNGAAKNPGPAAPSDFPAASLVKPEPVMITAADGMQIHGQLFLPPSSSAGRHPALIFFHGGSRRQMLLGFHYMYYYSNAYSLNQFLASQGYVVLSVNYRSGIGYGLNFREAINYGARGGSEYNDVIGAGLFLKSRSDVDPARIGVWGGSYGGYLTAMALSRASDMFAAGVDFHGVHDWSTLRGYLTSGTISGDPNDLVSRQEAARIAFESSPMASVDTWRSPVLLIHGDDDRNVEFSQTVMLAEALRKRSVTFEELIFPNEIHDFLLHRHWVQAYQATAGFFKRKLVQ
jgi:dipeptidyl aminopeptidase/acylaminoacyl peptidase